MLVVVNFFSQTFIIVLRTATLSAHDYFFRACGVVVAIHTIPVAGTVSITAVNTKYTTVSVQRTTVLNIRQR